MTTEEENREALSERIEYLRAKLQEVRSENTSLREQAIRQSKRADEEFRSWIRTHDAMNLLREDAMRVLEEGGARALHAELEAVRAERDKVLARQAQYRKIARDATQAKALVVAELNEAHQVIESMRQHIESAEANATAAANSAQHIIEQRDAVLQHMTEIATSWYKGEKAALNALGEMHVLLGAGRPVASAIERQRAVHDAQLREDF